MTDTTDQQSQAPLDAPPAPSPSTAKAAGPSAEKRYAAYDTTYLRYVGTTHATRKAAADDAKKRNVKKFEIREV